jgi:DNA-binding LacI/PurR family transcriptional regulator
VKKSSSNVTIVGVARGAWQAERSQVIGPLVPHVGTRYIGESIQGIDAELPPAQYDLSLYTTHQRKSKEPAHVVALPQG